MKTLLYKCTTYGLPPMAARLALFFNDLCQADEMVKSMWVDSKFGSDFLLPYHIFAKCCVRFLLAQLDHSRKHTRQGEAALKQFNHWIQASAATCSHF